MVYLVKLMTGFHEALLYGGRPKSMLSWKISQNYSFDGKIPSIQAPFQSLFPGFLQSKNMLIL